MVAKWSSPNGATPLNLPDLESTIRQPTHSPSPTDVGAVDEAGERHPHHLHRVRGHSVPPAPLPPRVLQLEDPRHPLPTSARHRSIDDHSIPGHRRRVSGDASSSISSSSSEPVRSGVRCAGGQAEQPLQHGVRGGADRRRSSGSSGPRINRSATIRAGQEFTAFAVDADNRLRSTAAVASSVVVTNRSPSHANGQRGGRGFRGRFAGDCALVVVTPSMCAAMSESIGCRCRVRSRSRTYLGMGGLRSQLNVVDVCLRDNEPVQRKKRISAVGHNLAGLLDVLRVEEPVHKDIRQ